MQGDYLHSRSEAPILKSQLALSFAPFQPPLFTAFCSDGTAVKATSNLFEFEARSVLRAVEVSQARSVLRAVEVPQARSVAAGDR